MRRTNAVFFATCLALMLASAPVRAQVLMGYLFGEMLSSETFNIGFEVGANFTNFEGLDGDRLNSPVFGLFADWRFSEHFHLGGAVLPIAGRGAQKIEPIPTGDPALDSQTAGGTMKRSIGYVEIPVLLKWAPQREEGFRVGFGPSLGIVTGAHDRYDAVTPAGADYVLERDIDVPGLDFGLSFDAEWRFPLLAIAVRYTHGLTDMSQNGDPEASYTRVLTGTGRIYLGKKPSSAQPEGE
jgi:hypothetical protein